MRFVRAAAPRSRASAARHLPGATARRRRAASSPTSCTVRDGARHRPAARGGATCSGRHGSIHRVVGILEPLQVQLAEVAPGARRRRHRPGDRRPVPRQGADEGRAAPARPALRAAPAASASWADAEAFVARGRLPDGAQAAGRHGLQGDVARSARSTSCAARCAATARRAPSTRRSPRSSCAAASTASRRSPIGGEVRFQSASRYYPTPLEVIETPWIQWVVRAAARHRRPRLRRRARARRAGGRRRSASRPA